MNLENAFVRHLEQLAERDRAALSRLRRSLSFPPGQHPPVYPYVEPFVSQRAHAADPLRKALYLAAGLYALHPVHDPSRKFAAALGQAAMDRASGSIEHRFIALLGAEPADLRVHIRHLTSLLVPEKIGFDYAALVRDLAWWLNPWATERRQRVRQEWARQFYQVYDLMGESLRPQLLDTEIGEEL